MTRRGLLAALGVGAAGVALTGCGSTGGGPSPVPSPPAEPSDLSVRFAAFSPADEPNGDLAKVTWPDWLDQFDPEVRRLYQFQVVHGDLMRWMPCYCGCHAGYPQGAAPGDGHRNNRDRYVEAVNPDGSVVFDSMAPT
jgi:hypothetical protein